MAEILRGRLLAKNVREKTAQRIAKLSQPPGLAAILVGENPASTLYVSLKEAAAKEVGIYFEKIVYPKETSTKELVRRVHELNKRNDIQGILVQLPLPDQDENKIIAAIDPNKDVDGFHPENRRRLEEGEPGLVPPVALAVMKLVEATRQPLRDKHGIIISNSEVFAGPLIALMRDQGIIGTFLPRITSALEAKLRVADIVVVAVGNPGFIKPEMVKEGSIIIDVGTTRVDGKLRGDVSDEAAEQAAFISPVPGGVGPLTVAYLLLNVLKASQLQK